MSCIIRTESDRTMKYEGKKLNNTLVTNTNISIIFKLH